MGQCCAGGCCCGIRSCVSKKKKRTVIEPLGTHEGYGLKSTSGCDLDLALVHKRIIAMGFPSVGAESWYRNPRDDTIDFLDENFGAGYRVYNVCSEADRQYDPVIFGGRVFTAVQWPDHLPPTVEMLCRLVADARRWLDEDEQHVAVVHCKAGKGRTGTVACCLLLVLGVCATPEEAIEFYGRARAHDGKGVTIPSQKRYISYFSNVFSENNNSSALVAAANNNKKKTKKQMILTSLTLHDDRFTHIHVFLRDAADGKTRSRYSAVELASANLLNKPQSIEASQLHVEGDFCVCIASTADWPCSCAMIWLNTDFVTAGQTLSFTGIEIDGWKTFFPEKEQRSKVIVELKFDDVSCSSGVSATDSVPEAAALAAGEAAPSAAAAADGGGGGGLRVASDVDDQY